MSCTLAVNCCRRRVTAVCWFDSSDVCAVITSRYGSSPKLVAIRRDGHVTQRVGDRLILLPEFLREYAQRGKVVLDLLERGQDRLAIGSPPTGRRLHGYCATVALRRPPSKMVSEIAGPTDQNRAGQVSQFEASVLSNPADALKVSVGKYAASATPIWALACATRRSSAATSGRRSSSCEGHAQRYRRRQHVGRDRREAEGRGRLSDQHRDRMFVLRPRDTEVGGLRLRGLQLHLGLRHGLIGTDAGLVLWHGSPPATRGTPSTVACSSAMRESWLRSSK